jgi:hypothetical protein
LDARFASGYRDNIGSFTIVIHGSVLHRPAKGEQQQADEIAPPYACPPWRP